MGNRMMHRYGFKVPEPLGMGLAISPAANYRCLLLIKNIPKSATLKELPVAGAQPDCVLTRHLYFIQFSSI
jgi:hypothetical protein